MKISNEDALRAARGLVEYFERCCAEEAKSDPDVLSEAQKAFLRGLYPDDWPETGKPEFSVSIPIGAAVTVVRLSDGSDVKLVYRFGFDIVSLDWQFSDAVEADGARADVYWGPGLRDWMTEQVGGDTFGLAVKHFLLADLGFRLLDAAFIAVHDAMREEIHTLAADIDQSADIETLAHVLTAMGCDVGKEGK